MPFYVSPEQAMKDKADYARKNIARGRNTIVIQYADGILFVAPNSSRALHKISEIYDRIAFAAVGMYNEFENLRKAGVRYADFNGYLYDRNDVTALGLANAYAQTLGTIFTESNKPYEVEIVVAEVGETEEHDQIYRITFDGSVADEHGYVAMGGQADRVAAALKERYSDGLTLAGALGVALGALADQENGDGADLTAAQLEVAVLNRTSEHHNRRFRRLTGARLEALLAEAKAAGGKAAGTGTGSAEDDSGTAGGASGTAGGGTAGGAAGGGTAGGGNGGPAGTGSAS
jgi:proteasome alpha subunit